MKNYLITGGCGFIGQHLANELIKSKCNIDIIDLPGKNKNKIRSRFIKYFSGDIAKSKIFRKFKKKYDVAFHLAAQTSSRLSELDYLKDIKTNIIGSYNFCEWSKKTKPRRVVFTSSMSVYGKIANNVHEDRVCDPKSVYGMSKLYSEKIFERLKDHGIKVTVFRLFNIYGPGQDMKNLNQGMFSIYLAQAIKNNKINITGSLNRYRDFVYIADTVKALLINPKKNKNWLMNLGTGRKTKVKDVIKIIKDLLLPKKIKVNVKETYFEDTWGSYANVSKLKSEGWSADTKLKKGSELTIKEVLKSVTKK
tara:strand:- start:2888 stop:3811 length:924 start_codon:yes stop_codon:yes gene_type:complete